MNPGEIVNDDHLSQMDSTPRRDCRRGFPFHYRKLFVALPEEKEEVVVRGLDTVIIACPGGDQWYIKSNCLAGYNEMVIMIETRDLVMRRDKCGSGYYKKSTIFVLFAVPWSGTLFLFECSLKEEQK